MYDREVKETGAYVFNRSSPGGLNLSGINEMSHICLRMSRFSFCMLRVFVLEREVGSINAPRRSSTKDIYLCFDTALNSSSCTPSCVSRVESTSTLQGLGKHNHFGLIWIIACFALKPIYICVCLLNQAFIYSTIFFYLFHFHLR